MKHKVLITILSGIMLCSSVDSHAQFATIDFSNLTQAILSFLQDGDNMAANTTQFLQNLGVMKEQLEFLKELNKRYKEVRSDLYQIQEVIRIATNYEINIRMFSYFVQRIKDLENEQLQYYQIRSLINQGFQYLLISSREVKRAKEYLSSKSEMSEDQRRRGLEDCDRRLCQTNIAIYNHIKDTFSNMDDGKLLAQAIGGLESSFKMNWQ